MSATATASEGFERLDALLAPDRSWLCDAAEGRALGQHILESPSRIVVLYGPPRSGRTQLIRRSVVPVIEQRWRVSFLECGDGAGVTAPNPAESIQILDAAERCLVDDAPRAALVRQLRMAGADNGPAKCVLVLQEDYLSRLFRLGGAVPGILDDLCEMPAMSGPKFLAALTAAAAELGMTLAPDFARAIVRDLEALRSDAAPGPELVAILAFELHRARGGAQTVTQDDYAALGGITGLLEEHLEYLVTNLPDGIDAAIGWAVLEEVLRTPAAKPTDIEDVAHRFDVGVEVPAEALRFLEIDRHVLRQTPEGGHRLVPPSLKAAVLARAMRIDEIVGRNRSLLRLGARHFVETGALLPPHVFSRIDAQRRELVVSDDEARLMLSCALNYSDEDCSSALAHWLRRVRQPSAKSEILLEAVCDPRAEVRRRAATCLRDCPGDEVQSQLHRLVLKDSDASVRDAGVSSLASMATDDLRESLLQETADPNSPYRVQAIDALRIFPDDRTIDRLCEIVATHATGYDGSREHAITVLGTYQTNRSMTALVKIALHDQDGEDRAEAARALGRVTSLESARVVLDSLESESRMWRRSPATPLSARAVLARVGVGAAALGAIVAGVFVHGLILALIGCVRVGAALTAAGALAMVMDWPLLWIITMTAGFVAPAAVLMRQRMAGGDERPFKRALNVWLFAGGCVSAYALVHGLPSLLIGRIRHGLSLIGLEALAVCLMLSSWILFSDAVELREIFTIASWANWLLLGTGVVLFAATWARGVGRVAVTVFGGRVGLDGRRPIGAVYHEVLPNAFVSALVVNDFCSDEPRATRSATRLLRRYPGLVRSHLTACWDTAGAPLKRRIFKAMARRPDAASVDFMRRVTPSLGWGRRLQHTAALWTYRLSLWPKPVLVVMPFAALVLASYGAVLWEFARKSPFQLVPQIQGASHDDAVAAIGTLGALAGSRDQRVSALAVTSLQLALADPSVASNPARADEILNTLPTTLPLGRLEETLATVLTAPRTARSTRERTIEFLRKRGTSDAVNTLRRFVIAPEYDESNAPDPATVVQLKLQAVEALGQIKGAGAAPLRALDELRFSPAVSAAIQDAARRAADDAHLLIAEERLEALDYATAIDEARTAGASSANDAERQRIANVLGRAYTLSGFAALRKEDYARAFTDLTSALQSGAETGSLLETLTLAQQLGFELHETVALNDPQAFESSYEAFKSAEPLSQRVPGVTLQFAADLAEAALTSGRYDEAYSRAQDAIDKARLQQRADTALNMQMISYAALILKRDSAGAKARLDDLRAALESLPPDFINNWVWTGTKRYIDLTTLPAAEKRSLRNLIDRVSRSKPAVAGK